MIEEYWMISVGSGGTGFRISAEWIPSLKKAIKDDDLLYNAIDIYGAPFYIRVSNITDFYFSNLEVARKQRQQSKEELESLKENSWER